MAQNIVRVIHRVVYYACIVGMAFLLIMMLLTTSDVIGRSIFNRPIAGTFEITQFMLAIIVLLGIGYAQQTRQHVRVELFVDKLLPRGRIAVDIIFTLIALIFVALLAWQGWKESFVAIKMETASDILKIPSYPFEFLIAVGAFLLALELLIKVINDIRGFKAGKVEEEGKVYEEITV